MKENKTKTVKIRSRRRMPNDEEQNQQQEHVVDHAEQGSYGYAGGATEIKLENPNSDTSNTSASKGADGGMLLPIGLGAAALAAAAGGGDSGGGTSGTGGGGDSGGGGGGTGGTGGGGDPPGGSFKNIHGKVSLGPVVPGNDLKIKVYDANNEKLAEGNITGDGTYSFQINQSYTGPIFLKVINNGPRPDYNDEAKGISVNMDIAEMRAVTVVEGSEDVYVNINPLTELAVRLVESGETIKDANEEVATLFGLMDDSMGFVDIIKAPVETTIDSGFEYNANLNSYGLALAAISGIEYGANVNTNDVLDLLKGVINGDLPDDLFLNELAIGTLNGLQSVEDEDGVAAKRDLFLANVGIADEAIAGWGSIMSIIANKTGDLEIDQLSDIGVTRVDDSSEISLIKSVLVAFGNREDGFEKADSFMEMQKIATVADKIMQYAAGSTPPITGEEFKALGLKLVGNLNDLLAEIAATNDSGDGVDTFAELEGLAGLAPLPIGGGFYMPSMDTFTVI